MSAGGMHLPTTSSTSRHRLTPSIPSTVGIITTSSSSTVAAAPPSALTTLSLSRLSRGMRATLVRVALLVAVVALHARPIRRLGALLGDVAQLVAVAALDDALVRAVLRTMAFLLAVVANVGLAIRAVAREVAHWEVLAVIRRRRCTEHNLLLPQPLHSTLSRFGGSGHSLAM